MRYAWVLLILVACWTAGAAYATTRDELLVQTQAADVLGGALTEAVTHAAAEIDAAAAARNHPATRPANASATPVVRPTANPAKPAQRLTYHELFDRTVARIKKQGNTAIDPPLQNMPGGQLFDEMTAMQQYNIPQYLRLIRLLDTIHSAHVPTTMPSLDSLAQHDATNNATWQKQRQEIRYAVVARILNQSSARQGFSGQVIQGQPATGGAASYGAAADDPRWQPFFYGPQDAMSGWNLSGGDPYAAQSSGGIYYRTDIRVNRDYDPRTNGFFDRRVNIEPDRRLNIHLDPRDNF